MLNIYRMNAIVFGLFLNGYVSKVSLDEDELNQYVEKAKKNGWWDHVNVEVRRVLATDL